MIASYKTSVYKVTGQLLVELADEKGKPAGSTYVNTEEEAADFFAAQQAIHNKPAATATPSEE